MMLQSIVNKLISLDKSTNTKRLLQLLKKKNVTIICDDYPAVILYFTFDQQQILFSSSPPEYSDTTINSTLAGFVQFMLNKNSSHITIKGDISVAELLQKLYLKLDIDWEEQLSHFTGDIIAHRFVQLLKKYRQQQKLVNNSLGEMVTEYLQEEISFLPTNCEMEHFLTDVDDLRLSIDRLEARIKLYEHS